MRPAHIPAPLSACARFAALCAAPAPARFAASVGRRSRSRSVRRTLLAAPLPLALGSPLRAALSLRSVRRTLFRRRSRSRSVRRPLFRSGGFRRRQRLFVRLLCTALAPLGSPPCCTALAPLGSPPSAYGGAPARARLAAFPAARRFPAAKAFCATFCAALSLRSVRRFGRRSRSRSVRRPRPCSKPCSKKRPCSFLSTGGFFRIICALSAKTRYSLLSFW